MRRKVASLFYILLTHVQQGELHYVIYSSLAEMKSLMKPGNAFEGVREV